MSAFEEYCNHDATALGGLVKKGEVSDRELLQSAIEQVEKWNPTLNAIVHENFSVAKENIDKMPLTNNHDMLFPGVPFLVKDLLTEVRDFPMTFGSNATRGYVAKKDCELVRRYRTLGLNIFGSTNTAEFGLMPVTESQRYGSANNPWSLSHNAGGSSGGSAAAVAAGIVPIAGATDGGGSIRIPAAFTGTFGFKPSRGLTPLDPYGEPWDGAAVNHVITRSVRDSAKALFATQGLTKTAPYISKTLTTAETDLFEKPLKSLRIAVCTQSPLSNAVSSNNIKAVESTCQLLTTLGHHVEPINTLWDGYALLDTFCPVLFSQVAADLQMVSDIQGKPVKRKDVEPTTWLLSEIGKRVSGKDFAVAKRSWGEFRTLLATLYLQYDLILTPTTACEAPLNGELSPKPSEISALKTVSFLHLDNIVGQSKQFKENFYESFKPFPFTLMANITGTPAMSVPVWLDGIDMPSAAHFMAPVGNDIQLLKLALQLEEARPWFNRIPTLS